MNIPKNDSKYYWTQHVVRKMMYYGLSSDRVKRVIRNPKRMEDGVAPGTLAAMQPGPNKKKPSEIWVMWKDMKHETHNTKQKNAERFTLQASRKVVITAWRYPGVSPVRGRIPIPADILAELKEDLFSS